MIYIRDLIRKKRNKEELTQEEIEFFIDAYYSDEILREQASALLTLMYTNGLSVKEMTWLTNKVAESGKLQELYKSSDSVLEIHPIGGVDDKVVIILMAICSALKLPVVKIVDREIGFLDRLVGINGYKFETDFNIINEKIQKKDIVIVEEPVDIAPVEKKLYKLRNDIACNDDISLIAMSLMSQKIAIGMKNLVFDISYGDKAYVKHLKDAKLLAKYLIQMGKELKKGVKCIITSLDEPVGKMFGNSLEIKEIIDALKGNMSDDVEDLVYEIGNYILMLVNESNDKKRNIRLIKEMIENGSALEKFNEFLSQSETEVLEPIHNVPVISPFEGYIEEINMSIIRTTAKELNAIRYSKEDYLDVGAGIEFTKKIGDKIEKGEILGYIYTNDENKINPAIENFKDAFKVSNKKVKRESRIKEKI